MQKEKIREQLSVLEERLEQLEGFFLSPENYSPEKISQFKNAKNTFSELQGLVQDEALRQRSIPTEQFVRKILPFLIHEANGKGYEINVGYYAEGKISMEMVEISMNAILTCIKSSLKCYQGMSRAHRIQKRLFQPFSFFLDVRADISEIKFSLIDDSFGYKSSFNTGIESEKLFKSMRTHMASHDGWFGNQSFQRYGGVIQFRIPQQRTRFDCILLQGIDCEVLLPSSCVIEQIPAKNLDSKNTNLKVFLLQENGGLDLKESIGPEFQSYTAIKIGVADFQFWILCKKILQTVRARRLAGSDFLDPSAWFRDFGVFLQDSSEVLIPLVDGSVLMDFYQKWGEK